MSFDLAFIGYKNYFTSTTSTLTGTKLGWSPLANSISAVYYKRGYKGDISESWYEWLKN